MTLVWVGIENNEIVAAHLGAWQKVKNIRRDPRVVLSLETGQRNEHGLEEYLVVYGRARITEGGAAELLQKLAWVYIGPGRQVPSHGQPAAWLRHPDHPRAGRGRGPVAGLSAPRLSPKRLSPKRLSPKRLSPKRLSAPLNATAIGGHSQVVA